jgi:outer membrane protein assembly factor BamB
VQQRIRIGDVDLAAAQGWHWVLVRTDPSLQVLDALELDDQGPPGEALIASAGDVVFSETRNNFNFQATVSRIGTGWTSEWTFPTRILLDEFSRGMAASSTSVAHVYTPSTSTADRQLELLDAANGSLIWEVPISQDFSDLAFDRDGNVIVTGRSAASRVARSDGSVTPLLTFTSGPTRVEVTAAGFLMLRLDPAPALYAYDAAWSERWRLALGEPTPSTQLQLRALANGDALVLITGQPLGGTLARVDSSGVVASTQHVCARTLLGVDAMDRALLLGSDSDELLLQPTL